MRQSLNFNWTFVPNFKDEYLKELKGGEIVNIPHSVKEVPYNYFNEAMYQIVSTYEKRFDVDNYQKDKKYLIKFDGFMMKAKIYFNDEYLGEFVSAYIPVEIDVTEFIKEKNNRLLVILDSSEDKNIPPFGFTVDYLTFSGIYREVYLYEEPKTYLRNIFADASIDGNVKVSYDVIGEDKIKLEHHLFKDDKEILSSQSDEFKVDNVELWDIDHPNLYVLKTTILGNNVTYETRFGFREAKFTNKGFYLNGKKIKLVGLNRHQGYPYMGYAASKSLQKDDADVLKNEIGVNVVRTSHYPQSKHFLDRCDEIGLLFLNEIPGWQHVSKEEAWRKQCLKNAEVMVKEQRNHPSLIAHGVRVDESIDDDELYLETNKIAHSLDPQRATIGVRNFKGSHCLEDVYGYNDFICSSMEVGLSKPKSVKTQGHPLLVTEYMGHMDPVKAGSDLEKRIEVALRHAKVIDDNFKYKNTCGAIGWCFADYHTHADFGTGDHICPHGVVDLYRNKKYTAYIYASQQDNFPVMEILSNMKPGDVEKGIFGDIYIATNCDHIELYKDGEFVTKYYPNSKTFKYLKHPLILVDDIVGETFKEDRFPRKIHIKIAKCFTYAAMHGYGDMPIKNAIFLAWCMFRYKMKYEDLVFYWNKYVGAWGGIAKTYVFKGYKNGELVKEISIGSSRNFDMKVECKNNILINEDTYDTTQIKIKHVDEHNQIATYSNRVIEIETSGPIELIGPKCQALHGGQMTIYIKSKNENGPAKVTLKMDNITKVIDLEVKSR